MFGESPFLRLGSRRRFNRVPGDVGSSEREFPPKVLAWAEKYLGG